jgi:hypothetical protein
MVFHFCVPSFVDLSTANSNGDSLSLMNSASSISTSSHMSLSCVGKCPGMYDNVYAQLDPNSIAGCEARDGPHCVDPTGVDSPYSQYQSSDHLQVVKILTLIDKLSMTVHAQSCFLISKMTTLQLHSSIGTDSSQLQQLATGTQIHEMLSHLPPQPSHSPPSGMVNPLLPFRAAPSASPLY